MKGFAPLVLGIFGTLAFSWLGLAYIPNLQIGHLDPQTEEDGSDAYPIVRSGMAERGRRVYVANGCFYCHSQQVRADYAAADIDRKWGDRRSAPRDYIYDRPALLGKMRLGPDLSNIGKRAPAEDENAPTNASPAAGTPPAPNAAASPGSPSLATAGETKAPSPGAPPSLGPTTTSPTAAGAAASPSQSPNPVANPKTPAQAQSPPSGATSAGSTNAANVATAGGSPAMQPALAAATGAAMTAEGELSGSPPLYSAAWHHQHLYSPRSLNLDSAMPAYKFLYDKRHVTGQESAEVLKLKGDEQPGEGWEIVPTYDAKCLVAYLMSLDQSHQLKEVKSSKPPSPPAPGKSTK